VGTKFHTDGSVRRFPGNTIICHVDPASTVMAALTDAHQAIRALDVRKRYALLPPSSYHMTVFEGVCDEIRTPERWPADIPLTATLDSVSAQFASALADFHHASALPFRLKAVEPVAKWGPVVLALEPMDENENRKLRSLRNRLSDRLKLRTPDHDAYVFHITLAYAVDWPDAAEEEAMAEVYAQLRESVNALGPIELGTPEFCLFEDMFAFHRQFFIAG
jgi:hypothetical protein